MARKAALSIRVVYYEGPRLGWCVVIRHRGQRTVRTCGSEDEARALAAQVERQYRAQGLDGSGPPTTVAALLDRFLAVKREQDLSRHTTDFFKYRARMLAAGLGPCNLSALTRDDTTRYVKERKAEEKDKRDPSLPGGASPATVAGELATLRMALGWAKELGWWVGDAEEIAAGFNLKVREAKSYLRRDEVAPFLAAVRAADALALVAVRLALGCGLRVGEVRRASWQDWDREGNALLIADTKDGDPRSVPVGDDLAKFLKVEWMRQGRPAGDAPIVPSRDGSRRATGGWLRKQVVAACRAARATVVSFHELRHTYATLALQAGVPLYLVSKALGHSSTDFTARTYAHALQADQRSVADRLEAFVGGAGQARKPRRARG